jgi:hypothetical protein
MSESNPKRAPMSLGNEVFALAILFVGTFLDSFSEQDYNHPFVIARVE